MIRTIKINNQIRLFFWIFNFNRVKIRELKASENFEKNKFRQASEPILTIFRLNLDFRSCIFKGRRAATPRAWMAELAGPGGRDGPFTCLPAATRPHQLTFIVGRICHGSWRVCGWWLMWRSVVAFFLFF